MLKKGRGNGHYIPTLRSGMIMYGGEPWILEKMSQMPSNQSFPMAMVMAMAIVLGMEATVRCLRDLIESAIVAITAMTVMTAPIVMVAMITGGDGRRQTLPLLI